MDSGQIIAIDANERHLDSMCDLLAAHGLEVRPAIDAAHVLEMLATDGANVLLLDLRIPGMDGLELLERVRAADPYIKAIVVSGDPSSASVAPVLRSGAYELLTKPYRPEQLVTSVRNALAQSRLEADNRRMHEQLRQSDQLHRYLVEKSPDIIYMLDEAGHFTFVNARAEQILGSPRDALLGRHWSSLFDAQALSAARWHFNERRTGERATHDFELQMRCLQPVNGRDTSYIELTAMGVYASGGGEPEFRGTYGVARDITAKKTTEELLEESQRRFRDLFEVSPDPVFISRADDGAIVDSNAPFRHLLAQLEQSGNTQPHGDCVLFGGSGARQQFLEQLRTSPAGATFDAELHIAGEVRFFNVMARLLGDDDSPHMLATLRDLTDHRSAERNRRELEALLQDSRKIITIGQIAGGIAHDFNNILASMIGYTELALMPTTNSEETRREYLGQVVDAGQRARDLVAQLLSFARTDTSDAHAVDVASTIEADLGLLRAALPRTVDIDTAIDDDLPQVYIDPAQLRQVLISLFINASDAIDGAGTVSLHAHRSHVEGVHCASCQQPVEGDFVTLEITDSGGGFQDSLQQVFELFVTSPTGSQSVGVGLALVHRIVHEYDGHVTVRDNAGRGTRFAVMLPVAAAELVQALPRIRRGRDATGRILVVDDEVSVSSFVADALRACGHRVVVFNDAPTALNFARDHNGGISLCVTDQNMPQLTGIELARELKALDPDVAVVLITGYAEAMRAAEQGRKEIDAFLPKPFRIEELTHVVEDLLGARIDDPADELRESTAGG